MQCDCGDVSVGRLALLLRVMAALGSNCHSEKKVGFPSLSRQVLQNSLKQVNWAAASCIATGW